MKDLLHYYIFIRKYCLLVKFYTATDLDDDTVQFQSA